MHTAVVRMCIAMGHPTGASTESLRTNIPIVEGLGASYGRDISGGTDPIPIVHFDIDPRNSTRYTLSDHDDR